MVKKKKSKKKIENRLIGLFLKNPAEVTKSLLKSHNRIIHYNSIQ